jgi:predicted nucleotidyltransferase
MTDAERSVVSETTSETLHQVLDDHDVRLGVLFGSAVQSGEPRDFDLAVEFKSWRPNEDGYADAYLALQNALEDALGTTVDLIDIHTAGDPFLAVVFKDGKRVYGPADRYEELKQEVEGSYPSTKDASERVAAAARRLREST